MSQEQSAGTTPNTLDVPIAIGPATTRLDPEPTTSSAELASMANVRLPGF